MRSSALACLVAAFTTIPFIGWAQLPNDTFSRPAPDSLASGLYARAWALGYMKNNELASDFADGQTWFGLQAAPSLVWMGEGGLQVEAGLWANVPFGREEHTQLYPLVALQAAVGKVNLRLGWLDGALRHGLWEPLFDIDNQFAGPVEYGLSAATDRTWGRAELWVDWREGIVAGDSDQEEFVAGAHVLPQWALGSLSVQLPLQAVAFHRGGQIDLNPGQVVTAYNLLAGVDASWQLQGPLRRVGAQLSLAQYALVEGPQEEYFYSQGYGWYGGMYADSKWGLLMAHLWVGNGYRPLLGRPLVSSESLSFANGAALSDQRELLFLRYSYDTSLGDGARLTARLEPVWDISQEQWLYSFGLYVSFGNWWQLWAGEER